MADNLVINVSSGSTASISTNEIGGSHYQIFKLAYGSTSSASLVTTTAPLPVSLSTGVTANIVNFTNPVIVVGNSAGDAVFVQGTVAVSGVSGTVSITGGIARNYTRDSISIYGAGGSTFIRSALVTTGNTAIGVSGDALKVYLQDAALTVNVGAVVGIQNAGATSTIRVEGFTYGTPIPVSVSGTAAINDTAILNGMTAIYGKVDDVYDALSAFGLVRPAGNTANRFTLSTTTAVQISSGFTCYAGVNIKSSSSNTDVVYVGVSSTISSNIGYELDPGEHLFLNVGNANGIYVKCKSTPQIVSFFAS